MQPSDLSAQDRERFYRKVERRRSDQCWLWRGTMSSTGYGQFQFGGRHGRIVNAHRIAWMLANDKEVPDRFVSCVCHTCDNPPCVNPAHLYLGDYSTNILDAIAKGYTPKAQRGEANYLAKLTDNDVREIRRRAAAGHKQRDIAATYGMSQGTIWSVIHRLAWAHVA